MFNPFFLTLDFRDIQKFTRGIKWPNISNIFIKHYLTCLKSLVSDSIPQITSS